MRVGGAAAPPDVIFPDLRLPDKSGLNAVSEIRQVDAHIPVVFVTLARSANTATEAMKEDAYGYLLKPLDMQKLDRLIREGLRIPAASSTSTPRSWASAGKRSAEDPANSA